MNLKDIFEMSKPIVEVVETVGAAVGASSQQKHDQATQLLAERVNSKLELPAYVEENTDEVMGLIIDLTVWAFNSLRTGWEKDTPLQEVAQQADPELVKQAQIGLNRG